MSGPVGNPPAAISDLRPTSPKSPKKLFTPAGTRLQTVLEGGDARGATFVAPGLRGPDEAAAEQSYTTIWSDAGLAAKESSGGKSRYTSWVTRRGGWKRLLVLLLILIVVLVGLVVGLVVGLRSQSKSGNQSTPTPGTGDSRPQGSVPTSTVTGIGSGSQPTSTVAGTSTATPSGFPVGAYSFVTFLNTVATDCTSNPSTWTCPPYTLYSSSPTRAMTTFNWNITQGDSNNDLRISSISNPFQNSFTDIAVSLMDEGKATEHYFFQVLLDRQVRPTAALTSDNMATVCYYISTTFQASLYTRAARSYPTKDMITNPVSYQLWPFAVKVEEVIGGGENVPNCYSAVDNRIGERVNSSSLTPQPAGNLCDCLYLNYL